MLIGWDPNCCQREQNPALSIQSFLASSFFFFFFKSMSSLNYITAKKHLKNSGMALLFYPTFSPLVFPHNCCHPLAAKEAFDASFLFRSSAGSAHLPGIRDSGNFSGDRLYAPARCPLLLAKARKEGKSPQILLVQPKEFAVTRDFHGWESPR